MLFFAVVLGTASNSFAKAADGFTKFIPSALSAVTIILCMYFLSQAMRFLPVCITYASFAAGCILGTAFVGIIKFDQVPSLIAALGLGLMILGVLLVNIFGQSNN